MSLESKTPRTIQQFFVPTLVILAIGLAFFSGTLFQRVKNLESGKANTDTTNTTTGTTTQAVSLDTIKGLFDKDLIKFGDAKRKVLFIEMADPSCPYCHIADGYNAKLAESAGTTFKYVSKGGTYVPPGVEMEKLVKSGDASYVYIYYPGHSNGEMGMKALYCANEKGKFWEAKNALMTDAGYTLMNTTVINDKTKSSVVADFFKGVVDSNFMKSCLDSGKYDAQLASDQALATSLGIQGTPSFYVNATNFPGAYSYTDMKSAVDSALK